MKSELTSKNIIDFWLRVYFDLSESYEIAAIKRAYRDFNRTLEDFPKDENERAILRNNWINILVQQLEKLKATKFSNQEEFTIWHQSTCYKLCTENPYKLNQGQAQKWINMTLKYLFAMGEENVSGISQNYEYFHVPIDNIIMEKLSQRGIAKFPVAWSKIKDYDSYHKYQIEIRNLFKGRIPMDVEFELFNEK